MKLLVVLALIGASLAIQRIPMRRTETIRQRLTRTGQWEAFVEAERRERMISVLSGQTGDVTERTKYDFAYLAEVDVGTPAQKFQVVPDTGSPIFWVVDKSCGHSVSCADRGCSSFLGLFCYGCKDGSRVQRLAASGPCDGKNKFDQSKSSTYKHYGKTFSIQYGTGSSSGYYGNDIVSFAGVAIRTHVAQANSLASFFTGQDLDGILGLSWPQLSDDGVAPVVTGDMRSQGVLASNVFGVYMTETGGELHLGGIDNSKFTGEINYIPVTSKGFWQFNVDSFSVNGQRVAGSGSAISDTGTSAISVSQSAQSAIARALGVQNNYDNTQGLYKMDSCDQKLADIDININGVTYSISVDHYKFDLGSQGCYVGIDGSGGYGGPDYILGDCFIRAYYAIYDSDNARVGFAKH